MPSGIPTTSPAMGTIHFRQSKASRTLHHTRPLLTTAVTVKTIEALAGDLNSGIIPIDTWANPKPAMPWTIDAARMTSDVSTVTIQSTTISDHPADSPAGDSRRSDDSRRVDTGTRTHVRECRPWALSPPDPGHRRRQVGRGGRLAGDATGPGRVRRPQSGGSRVLRRLVQELFGAVLQRRRQAGVLGQPAERRRTLGMCQTGQRLLSIAVLDAVVADHVREPGALVRGFEVGERRLPRLGVARLVDGYLEVFFGCAHATRRSGFVPIFLLAPVGSSRPRA